MFHFRLPAFRMEREIVKTIGMNQVTVIAGDTGCGKVRGRRGGNDADDQKEVSSGQLFSLLATNRRPRYLSWFWMI